MNNEGFYFQVAEFAVVPVFVLFYWRGIWVLMDEYFSPDDLELSAWTSAYVGYGGMIAIYIGHKYQSHYYNMLDMYFSFKKGTLGEQLFDRIHALILGFFVVSVWRAIWLLQDLHLLTSDRLSSGGRLLLLDLAFYSVYAVLRVF